MRIRELAVRGAFELVPTVYEDDRGLFVSPFQEPGLLEAVGHGFSVAQTNHSRSRRGVLRGVHFTRTPPGQSKYVYCARGRALDVQVDLRDGSPGFGRTDAVEVDDESFRCVYLPVGVGHAFLALTDDTVMSYMVSTSYVPSAELAVHPYDPDLAIPWPDLPHVLSEKDAAAPTLAELRTAGTLPRYADCVPVTGVTSGG